MDTARPTITFDGDDYRVPDPDGREASAYYTDDKEDAIWTGRLKWGDTFVQVGAAEPPPFRFRRVTQHPGADD